MERSSNNSMNNGFTMSRNETMTFSGDESPEESSWSMYFEDDFFLKGSSSIATEDCSSSSVSDAASFVGTKKISITKQEGSKKFNMKRTRHREEDLEDTASSPSHSPNVCSMMNLLDNNTRHVGGDETINEMKGEMKMQKRGGLSIDLKKKGLCLVPLSMVTNFLA